MQNSKIQNLKISNRGIVQHNKQISEGKLPEVGTPRQQKK